MSLELIPTNFFQDIDLIVPIPLAKERHRKRGYNQSEWIAKGISQVTRIPTDIHIVTRTVSNQTQTHLTYQERLENVEGIFHVKKNRHLAGKHILLVDDVVTSGATITSCAKALTHSCAVDIRISVLTLSASSHLGQH